MIWIWTDTDEDDLPVWVDYDDERSTFEPYKMLGGERWDENSGTADFRTTRHKLSAIEALKCLPSTGSSPLVDDEIAGVIEGIAGPDAVQFSPAHVMARDGETDSFCLAIPLQSSECLDLQATKGIKWALPEQKEILIGYTRLVFKPDCLGTSHIVLPPFHERTAAAKSTHLHVILVPMLSVAPMAPGTS